MRGHTPVVVAGVFYRQPMINITTDLSGLTKAQRFIGAYKSQLPFAASVALNQTARQVQQAYKAQTSQSFFKPVAFTRNAFRYDKSNKSNLVATVYPSKDRSYLNTQILGGQRRWKDYEGLIRGLAASSGNPLPGNRKLYPTAIAQNAAGNPKRRLFGELQSRLSTTDRGGYMIGIPRGGNRAPGVYRRSRGRLVPYFLVSDQEPNYDRLFPFERLGNDTVRRVYPTELSRALDRALASSRR
jgi:hypothetical protein